MGLSEREQELLDEMERSLYQSEADVMHTPSGVRRALNLRSLVLGIVVAIVGLGILVGGVAAQQLWLGLIGFGAMLGGVVLASMRGEATPPASGSGSATRSTPPGQRSGLSDRLSQRWDERMDGER